MSAVTWAVAIGVLVLGLLAAVLLIGLAVLVAGLVLLLVAAVLPPAVLKAVVRGLLTLLYGWNCPVPRTCRVPVNGPWSW